MYTKTIIILKFLMCVIECMFECPHATAHLWGSEDPFQERILSFHHVGSTQVGAHTLTLSDPRSLWGRQLQL